MVGYVSSQFVGGGKAFAASFGLSPTTGVLLTALIVLAYTALGGFLAVSLTDTIQAIIMIVALVVVPVIALADRGGLLAVLNELRAFDPTLVDPLALSAGVGLGFLGIGLGSPGNPHIIVRYMSIAKPEQLRASAVIGTIWNVVMAWGALFIGLAGRAYFSDVSLLPGADTEQLYPFLASQLLHPVAFGIVVASIFAAIMSTAWCGTCTRRSCIAVRRSRKSASYFTAVSSWFFWLAPRSSWGSPPKRWSSGWSCSPGRGSGPRSDPHRFSPSTGAALPGPG
jgi:Na+/proline symporter